VSYLIPRHVRVWQRTPIRRRTTDTARLECLGRRRPPGAGAGELRPVLVPDSAPPGSELSRMTDQLQRAKGIQRCGGVAARFGAEDDQMLTAGVRHMQPVAQ
jgi:hypothetical protein